MNLNPAAERSTTDAEQPDWIAEALAEKAAQKAAERAAKLLAPSQPYMARKHLLPPPPENPSLAAEYVRCAKIFARAVRAGVVMHLFNPSAAQREDNVRRALGWYEQQRAKGSGSVAPWARKAFDDEIALVRNPPDGYNDQLFKSAASLYEIVAAGALDETTVETALRDAMRDNGYQRDKGERAVSNTINSARRTGFGNPRDLSGVHGGI